MSDADKNDEDLKSFQIGLMSGASTGQQKKTASDAFEISRSDYPTLSSAVQSKATFKKKTNEKLEELKAQAKGASSEEQENTEKAIKAWERALELLGKVSVKE